MCLEDHSEVLRAALAEELERCHPIQQDAIEDDASQMVLGQVLHQERQVVAEIKVGLAR